MNNTRWYVRCKVRGKKAKFHPFETRKKAYKYAKTAEKAGFSVKVLR